MTNAAIASAVQGIAPSALIELFQLELNVTQHGVSETYYFHAGTSMSNNGDLIWNGQPYMALPIEVEGFEYSGQGTLPRPRLRISNILGTITTLILTLPEGLEGAKLTRIRTLARFIDSANFPAGADYLLTEDSFALMYEDSTFIFQEVGNRLALPIQLLSFHGRFTLWIASQQRTATWLSLSWLVHLTWQASGHPSGSASPVVNGCTARLNVATPAPITSMQVTHLLATQTKTCAANGLTVARHDLARILNCPTAGTSASARTSHDLAQRCS